MKYRRAENIGPKLGSALSGTLLKPAGDSRIIAMYSLIKWTR
jgi:hypothetical protein